MLGKILSCAAFLLLVQKSSSGSIRSSLFRTDTCSNNSYRCLNGRCIPKQLYCNSINDCGDNSDEKSCYSQSECPRTSYFRCPNPAYNPYNSRHYSPQNEKIRNCIPIAWKCDGVGDCQDNSDEEGCDITNDKKITAIELDRASKSAKDWILKGRKSDRKLQKWGLDLTRKAVALYLSSKAKSHITYSDEIAYELSSNFLFEIALKKMDDVPTADIASYVNAFLVTCINPRQFYVLDLVKELRIRLDKMNGTNPYALVALCNAQELITKTDVQKIEEAFSIAQENNRIDTMAMIILALSCASAQQEKVVDQEDLSNLVLELKKLQYRNGTVENVKTTALVLQALFASEEESNEDEFDEIKAMQQILLSKNEDGSFGNLANTYYVLPVLNGLSLINISTEHCPTFIRDEREGLQHLRDQVGEKISVKYSLWLSADKFIQRTLTMTVPTNTSFYGIMEYASDLDVNYKFEYNVRSRKPFVYSLYGFMDDPEKEMFWSLNHFTNETSGEVEKIHKSPAEVYPKMNDHFVYWYKSEA